jgi:hypothetical protein
MPKDKDFKRLVRGRIAKTGESYTAARAQLRPRETPDAGKTGKNPETCAAVRLLAHSGARAPHTGEPFSEDMLLGLGGGIGVAYFVFEYKDFTSFYIGGRINEFVQKEDFLKALFGRLGLAHEVSETTSEAVAEKQLRAALDAGGLAIVVLDMVELGFYGLPREWSGMVPHTVAVALKDGEPAIFDVAPDPFPMTWQDLRRARARLRSAKNRMITLVSSPATVDLPRAAADAIRQTCRGMLEPPMTNFGLAGLEKWAVLLTTKKDKKGWPAVFSTGPKLFEALRWLVHWVEMSGTGGGAFRRMYSGFLSEASAVLGRPELAEASSRYERLAGEWAALAEAAFPAAIPPLGRIRELMAERRRLIELRGPAAAAELERLRQERDRLEAEVKRSFPIADVGAFLADLRERVLKLHDGEEGAISLLRAAVAEDAPDSRTRSRRGPPSPR